VPSREEDVLRLALDRLEAVLPGGWLVHRPLRREQQGGPVAVLAVEAPDGARVELLAEVKRQFVTRDVPFALERLRRMSTPPRPDNAAPVLVARYLSPPARERVEAAGANYLDATGNVRIVSDDPPFVVVASGSDRDPWRGSGRPRGSLRGAPAARVVRALVDLSPPYSVPQLVHASGASTGATYRVVDFLAEEGLLERQKRGPIRHVEWRRLLLRWSDDYGFDRADVVRRYVAPRGVESALDGLRTYPDRYVVTGSVAAQFYVPYAPAVLLTAYVDEPVELAEFAGLREVEAGANVLVAANSDDFAMERATRRSGLEVAAPSQIAVDLLSGPGRSPAEAEALLDWMEEDEGAWRP
jgi:hypothetical protein